MNENLNIDLRPLRLSDFPDLKKVMKKAYAGMDDDYWRPQEIQALINLFPEGQIGIVVNGSLVAAALTIKVHHQRTERPHTFDDMVGDASFQTHDEHGDTLYGIEMVVDPDYRNMRLGRRLYDARKELCEHLNMRSIVIGGRIPHYKNYASKMTPSLYIEKVRMKEIYDPTLSFQLSNGFQPKRILSGYLEGDKQSQEYGVLLEWANIYFERKESASQRNPSIVRLGLVQWQMRSFSDLDELMDQAEFFVDAISGYESDFIMFPEYINAPLMAPFNNLSEAQAIRELSKYTGAIRDRFSELAVSYNINIITGSMPLVEDEQLLNVGYLCRRDGSIARYEKIHITPSEVKSWGMVGSDSLKIFDTDCGKIGIMICYDVEFPELSRLYADAGMKILFVPFLTDTQNGYMRVRRCAQARAIENECYVAIAGCVGNLPRVENMDIQYAQSAVFTPSDFAFPTNAIKAETTPNTEMTLIADVDLDLLKELHLQGSVRNLLDRRKDLFDVKLKHDIEVQVC
jgi:predicted amidohydrolase/ribosomal protein S18 acetylase RimI-like enzyme